MRAGGADLTVLSSPSGRPTWPRLSRAVSQGAPLVVVTSTRTELSGLRAMWTSSPWYRQLPISHPTLVSSSFRASVSECRRVVAITRHSRSKPCRCVRALSASTPVLDFGFAFFGLPQPRLRGCGRLRSSFSSCSALPRYSSRFFL